MPSTPFGEHLKREREMRGVTLEEVAAATRISTRFLEAIEGEQWDRLPGGAFTRGFIRSIARYLGLDEESTVAEYDLEVKGTQTNLASHVATEGMPRDWRPVIVAGIALLLIIIGAAFAIHHFRSKARSREQQQSLAQPFPGSQIALPLLASSGGSH